MLRTGLIAKKLGMTRVYDAEGAHVPVTVLKIDRCQVVQVKTVERDGYSALKLGAEDRRASAVNQPQRGEFKKANMPNKATMAEFRVTPDAVLPVGAELSAEHFVAGQYVDVAGITKGRGFAGVVRRYKFGGLRATHGVSVAHNRMGSTGCRQDPGRVFKNKKMPGHMGVDRVTQQNLKVVAVDVANNLLLVQGSVPGFEGSLVMVRDAVKRPVPKEAPKPAGLKSNVAAAAPAEVAAQA